MVYYQIWLAECISDRNSEERTFGDMVNALVNNVP